MFRLAAQGAMQSKTAIGAFIRRIKARLGAPTAINAGAHKLAQLFYRIVCSSSEKPTSSRVKSIMKKSIKTDCSVISANGPKNSAFNSRLWRRSRL